MSAIAPLPLGMLVEGIEPSRAVCPRRPRRRAFAVTPHQRNLFGLAPGEGLEPSSPVPKTGVLPLDDPGMQRTRHDSNVRPQAPQTCALVHLSYGFKRVWRKVRESNPQESSNSDSFRDCSACPCPTFRTWQGRPDSNREERVWSPPVCAFSLRPFAYASGGTRTPKPTRGPQLYRLLPSRFGL